MASEFSANIERWPLDRLIPHARNARTHSEEQVAQIAGSIAEFGFVNPVLVGDDGVMVAGHGRVLAARKLGLSEVPVIVLSHLTPTQRRALMIADNRIAENAGWDDAMLGAELAALRDEDVDLALLGFDETDIDRLLAGTLDRPTIWTRCRSLRSIQSAVRAISGSAASTACCAVTPPC
jgi:ParB-like chromosome segregation protein Spo0J